MAWQKIQRICGQCQGTGIIFLPYNEEQGSPTETECTGCEGKGYIPFGRLKVEAD